LWLVLALSGADDVAVVAVTSDEGSGLVGGVEFERGFV
jgi:hypothetical protein